MSKYTSVDWWLGRTPEQIERKARLKKRQAEIINNRDRKLAEMKADHERKTTERAEQYRERHEAMQTKLAEMKSERDGHKIKRQARNDDLQVEPDRMLAEPLQLGTERVPLESEKIVVQAPMSFTGSTARASNAIRSIRRWAGGVENDWVRWLLAVPLAVGVIIVCIALLVSSWLIILAWYLLFGVLLLPYRIVRRGSRKRRLERKRHRELLDRN